MITTLTDLLPEGKRRGAEAEKRLHEAYVAFYEGRAGKTDAHLILVDLAMTSGYFHVTGPGTSNEDVQRSEGSRFVFGRVMRLLNLPQAELMALAASIATETTTDHNEGTI